MNVLGAMKAYGTKAPDTKTPCRQIGDFVPRRRWTRRHPPTRPDRVRRSEHHRRNQKAHNYNMKTNTVRMSPTQPHLIFQNLSHSTHEKTTHSRS